ncbi:MAG TPA: penicillin-binding protein, partial [Nitratifractor sp.]|nr:penicillin-binding protein [Nitratifractor sp.]
MILKVIKFLVVSALLVAALLVGMFSYSYYSVDSDVKKLTEYTPNLSTQILDRNGKLLGYIFKKRHRLYAKYNEIPISVVEGVVAMEDTMFFEHHGVNPDAILRAVIKDIKAGA